MAVKTEHAEIPEQITIGEQSFVVKDTPELQSLVQSVTEYVQKVEKDKLYATIEGLKKQVKELGEKINTPPSIPPPNGGNNPPMNPSKYVSKPDPEDVLKNNQYKETLRKLSENGQPVTAETVAQIIDARFNESIPALMKEILDPVKKELTKSRDLQVKSYRDSRLAQLGDTVVPELVKGNTEEEIESSIPMATEVRKRYPVGTPAPETPNPPPAPPKPGENPPAPLPRIPLGEEKPINIKGMSMGDFEKEHDALEKRLHSEVASYPVMGQ